MFIRGRAATPSLLFEYPQQLYPSVVDWWEKGGAQLSSASASKSITHFFSDRGDFVNNFFANVMFFIVDTFIPVWDSIVSYLIVRYIFLLIPSGAIYDLVKTMATKLFEKNKEV